MDRKNEIEWFEKKTLQEQRDVLVKFYQAMINKTQKKHQKKAFLSMIDEISTCEDGKRLSFIREKNLDGKDKSIENKKEILKKLSEKQRLEAKKRMLLIHQKEMDEKNNIDDILSQI